MHVDCSNIADFDAWIALTKEVEPLFGPMADEMDFHKELRQAILNSTAFCVRSAPNEKDAALKGGIIISKESNEIAWFAVSNKYRRKGYGRHLLKFAINNLNKRKSIFVQTFDETVPEGKAARKLYIDFGFSDYKNGGPNPAGVPTAIMQLSGKKKVVT